MVKPSARKEMAYEVVKLHNISIRMVCTIFNISQTCYRHEPQLANDNTLIADWLIKLTDEYCDWGFGMCFDYLRHVKKFKFNHKCVYRIYCELALNLRIKVKRRIKRPVPDELREPEYINDIWSLDFMYDNLSNGQSYRVLNVIDDYKREGLLMETDMSLPATRVTRSLDQLLEYRSAPTVIRCDNGPEFTSYELQNWAAKKGICIEYIQPGKLKKFLH